MTLVWKCVSDFCHHMGSTPLCMCYCCCCCCESAGSHTSRILARLIVIFLTQCELLLCWSHAHSSIPFKQNKSEMYFSFIFLLEHNTDLLPSAFFRLFLIISIILFAFYTESLHYLFGHCSVLGALCSQPCMIWLSSEQKGHDPSLASHTWIQNIKSSLVRNFLVML